MAGDQQFMLFNNDDQLVLVNIVHILILNFAKFFIILG